MIVDSKGGAVFILVNQKDLTDKVFSVQQDASSIRFTHEIPNSLRITKLFTLTPNSELLNVELYFENLSSAEYPLSYSLVSGINSKNHQSRLDMRYSQVIASVDNKKKKFFIG